MDIFDYLHLFWISLPQFAAPRPILWAFGAIAVTSGMAFLIRPDLVRRQSSAVAEGPTPSPRQTSAETTTLAHPLHLRRRPVLPRGHQIILDWIQASIAPLQGAYRVVTQVPMDSILRLKPGTRDTGQDDAVLDALSRARVPFLICTPDGQAVLAILECDDPPLNPESFEARALASAAIPTLPLGPPSEIGTFGVRLTQALSAATQIPQAAAHKAAA